MRPTTPVVRCSTCERLEEFFVCRESCLLLKQERNIKSKAWIDILLIFSYWVNLPRLNT